MQSWLPSRTQPRLRILPWVMNYYLAQDVPDRLMPKKVTLYIVWREILKLFHKARQLEICDSDRNNIGWQKSNAEETCGLELTTWMTSIIASGYLYTGNITAFRTRHCDRCTAISQTYKMHAIESGTSRSCSKVELLHRTMKVVSLDQSWWWMKHPLRWGPPELAASTAALQRVRRLQGREKTTKNLQGAIGILPR